MTYQAKIKLEARLTRLEAQAAKVKGRFVIVGENGKLRVRVFGTQDAMQKLIPTLTTTSHYEVDSRAFIIRAEEFMAREIAKCKQAIHFFEV